MDRVDFFGYPLTAGSMQSHAMVMDMHLHKQLYVFMKIHIW